MKAKRFRASSGRRRSTRYDLLRSQRQAQTTRRAKRLVKKVAQEKRKREFLTHKKNDRRIVRSDEKNQKGGAY